MFARLKAWWIGGAALLAAIAGVLGNIDKVGAVLQPWLLPQSSMHVSLESPPGRALTGAVEGPRVFEARVVAGGGTVTFDVPANARYTVAWQGVGFKAAQASGVIVPREPLRWRLFPAGREQDQDILTLKAENAAAPLATAPASAGILIASTAAARGPGTAPAAGVEALPEVDRAQSVIGLFEVGTTRCTGTAIVTPYALGFGCLGASLPGPVAAVITKLGTQSPGLLDAVLGEEAALVRDLVNRGVSDQTWYAPLAEDAPRRQRLRERLQALVATPEFRIELQRLVFDWYNRALLEARALGLQTERGVLFVFDRVVQQGPGGVRSVRADYEARIAAGGQASERERIALLASLLEQRVSQRIPEAFRAQVRQRIVILASGKGTFRGIAFDLDALGISDQVPMPGMAMAIQPQRGAQPPAQSQAPAALDPAQADRLRALIVRQLGVEAARVTPEARFVDDFGADDLDVVELMMAVEEAFAIEIPDEQQKAVRTVAQLGALVARLRKP